MTTSSSDTARGTRCTRISPSAILDDRLTGRDLDWARDHLRRCDTCRDRIEDFQEMRLRLDRLPHAPLSAVAIEDAFVVVVPNAPRPVPSQARLVGAPTPTPTPNPTPEMPFSAPYADVATSPLPDVASVPDLLSELEREIFRDWAEHPAGLMAGAFPPGTTPDIHADPVVTPEASEAFAQVEEVRVEPEQLEPPMMLRQVPVESGRQPEHAEEAIQAAALASGPLESALVEAPPVAEAIPPAIETAPPAIATAPPVAEADPPIAAAEPAAAEADLPVASESQPVTATPATHAPGRTDTAIRLAVGLGAAACVLLAALLYETGWFPTGRPVASTTPRPAATAVQPSHSPTAAPTVKPTPTPTPAPTPPPPVVLATLGQGVSGESVFRIRPGTAVSSYTRLVFDLTGGGLPTMVVTQPDALHLQVTFKNTGGANVPVGGIHSPQVQGIEPAVQQGPDLVITIDLAAPIRLTDFTLPPGSGYAPRLVLDLHSA